MPVFPEENDFLSLFECEPILLDTTSKDLPFYYNQATYQFSNGVEEFNVTLSPASGEVKIRVTLLNPNRLVSLLDLKRVDKFEIISDKKDHSSVLLTIFNEQTIEIDFKPNYKLIFKGHFTR